MHRGMSTATEDASPVAAWSSVGILMVLSLFSFVDRQIISLLVDPIKADLGLSDTQVGLLQGLAFYAVGGWIRALTTAITVGKDTIAITLCPEALGIEVLGVAMPAWNGSIPCPARKAFREAKLRIDGKDSAIVPDRALVDLIAEAIKVRQMVLASPECTLNQIASRENRCRTRLARLLRISWLSPRIVEAIACGTQPSAITPKSLLATELPIAWHEQERLLGLP
jgi:hypothetical protein